MSDFSGDQVHPASPARREQARRDGDYAKSHELSAAVQMIGAVVVAYLTFGPLAKWLRMWTTEIWTAPTALTKVTASDVSSQLSRLAFSSISVLLPIAALMFLVGVLSHWCQTGPVFLTKPLAPDATRLSPNRWFGRVFSLSTLAFPLIGLPKALLALVVMAVSCWFHREQFFALGSFPANVMAQQLFSLVLLVCSHVAITLLLASFLDFGLKYLGFQKKIRMTDQQLRDETRMQNGDPQISAQRRALQRTMR
jgi:flagellar biosynthetic protein FlhB